ncbi:hypothetical protein N7454_007001, partial [Penicillium verhagenii]
MDVTGLILGVAGLFSACMDVVERFDSWKDAAIESRALSAQLEAQKLRFKQWGEGVGIKGENLLERHDRRLEDRETIAVIWQLLSTVNDILGSGASATPNATLNSTNNNQPEPHTLSLPPFASKRRRVYWALRQKVPWNTRVEQFTFLVESLHSLVPVESSNDAGSGSHGSGAGGSSPGQGGDPGRLADLDSVLKKMEMKIEADTRRELHNWLLGPYLPNEKYETTSDDRTEGTCQWILNRPWFRDWSESHFPNDHAKFLWVNGPAGFGKSMLCGKVISHLTLELQTPVVYFFFSSDLESRRDPFLVIKSWLCQFLAQPAAFEVIRERWLAQQGQRATRPDSLYLLREITKLIPGCSLIIDGLDECTWVGQSQAVDESDTITRFLLKLKEAVIDSSTRVFIMSRDEPEIHQSLTEDTFEDASLFQYRILPDDVRSDIELYSRALVWHKLPKKKDSAKEIITQKLVERCDGQFLWIKLLQDEEFLRSGKSQGQIERAINSIPRRLESVYERNWTRILDFPEDDRDRAFSLLRWTAFALRPLTVGEIAGALLVSHDSDEVLMDEQPDCVDEDYLETIISYLGRSLVDIRTPQAGGPVALRTVHLAHFSVKEYLLTRLPISTGILQLNSTLCRSTEVDQSTLLAKMCLRYVDCHSVWVDESADEYEVLAPFREYAANSWPEHISSGDSNNADVLNLIKGLFDTESPTWIFWRRSYRTGPFAFISKEADSFMEHFSPLQFAGWLGLPHTLEYLIREKKYDVNEKCQGLETTALAGACAAGSVESAEVLLRSNADVNLTAMNGYTALHWTSQIGHLKISEMLFDHGAEMKPALEDELMPVHVASRDGNLDVLKLLIEKGADIEARTKQGSSPLFMASRNGRTAVVEFLLQKKAIVSAHNNLENTCLHIACRYGHTEVAALLILHGANVAAKNHDGRTPLVLACVEGHLACIELLLDHGADLSESTKYIPPPLLSAASHGQVEVVKSLLQRGADVNTRSRWKRTALNSAVEANHYEVVKILLQNGAEIDLANDTGMTPLYTASLKNHLDMAKLLLDNGANVNAFKHGKWSPLNVAAEMNHSEMMEILLDQGADIELANEDGVTPLYAASYRGHVQAVKVLLEHGANVNTYNSAKWSPLNVAADMNHSQVMEILLDNGADTELAKEDGVTPLYTASYQGHVQAVKVLLEHDANVNTCKPGKWSPLHVAADMNHSQVMEILLDNGADTELAKDDGATPLYTASYHGHVQAVEVLLEHGANFNSCKTGKWSPLNIAAEKNHKEVMTCLLNKGADIELANEAGATPLYIATFSGDTQSVRLLLEHGADVNSSEQSYNWTSINYAALNGSLDLVKLLLQKGANITIPNCHGWTPIHSASMIGHVDILSALLQASVGDLDIRDRSGRTPFMIAAVGGHFETLRYLSSKGSSPDLKDIFGANALFMAVRNGHEDAAAYLLELTKPSTELRDGLGYDLLFWAYGSGSAKVPTLVRDALQGIANLSLASEANLNRCAVATS